MTRLHILLSLFWVEDGIKILKQKFELQNKLSSIDSFLRMLVAEKFYLEPENLAGVWQHQFCFFLDILINREGFVKIDLQGGGMHDKLEWEDFDQLYIW